MTQTAMQILEVRAAAGDRPVTVTAAVSAAASPAIHVALGEQLDRRRATPADTAEEVLALREAIALAERFAPLAAAEAHAVVALSDHELRLCLLELTAYVDRVDGDHFLPVDVRARLGLIREILPVLWDGNTAAIAAAEPVPHGLP
jgi:hypothetical protein